MLYSPKHFEVIIHLRFFCLNINVLEHLFESHKYHSTLLTHVTDLENINAMWKTFLFIKMEIFEENAVVDLGHMGFTGCLAIIGWFLMTCEGFNELAGINADANYP